MLSENFPCRFEGEGRIVNKWKTTITLCKNTCSKYGQINHFTPCKALNIRTKHEFMSLLWIVQKKYIQINTFSLCINMRPALRHEPWPSNHKQQNFGRDLNGHDHSFYFLQTYIHVWGEKILSKRINSFQYDYFGPPLSLNQVPIQWISQFRWRTSWPF